MVTPIANKNKKEKLFLVNGRKITLSEWKSILKRDIESLLNNLLEDQDTDAEYTDDSKSRLGWWVEIHIDRNITSDGE